ncbi:putative E3 ubiquitin-protein ligase UBR7 [Achroia grisella]|uniref:putative E3 ubiquitin-protein ligase UBR7 n=1 Tax=Achroia grisella TaxID=688607 RepID=UPI0027D2FE0E|nr:putative E3 ubiquitin-protein ligase UBR7 [Achroia grisella]
MSSNGVTTSEEADMAECEGEKVVTMLDVLQEQEEFEEDANAVLGASDEKNCTYPKGYIKRQAIYACLTCCEDAKTDPAKRAGVCLACSLACHENHELIELYTKRNFCCDCGNSKFNSHPCQFTTNKTDLNENNEYNQNFSGVYCTCHRPYPDPEATFEDEMIQCIICEDWLHASHLEATVPGNDHYSEMICKACMENIDFLHDYSNFAVNVECDIDVITTNGDTTMISDITVTNGELDKNKTINDQDIDMTDSKMNDINKDCGSNKKEETTRNTEDAADNGVNSELNKNSSENDKCLEQNNDSDSRNTENNTQFTGADGGTSTIDPDSLEQPSMDTDGILHDKIDKTKDEINEAPAEPIKSVSEVQNISEVNNTENTENSEDSNKHVISGKNSDNSGSELTDNVSIDNTVTTNDNQEISKNVEESTLQNITHTESNECNSIDSKQSYNSNVDDASKPETGIDTNINTDKSHVPQITTEKKQDDNTSVSEITNIEQKEFEVNVTKEKENTDISVGSEITERNNDEMDKNDSISKSNVENDIDMIDTTNEKNLLNASTEVKNEAESSHKINEINDTIDPSANSSSKESRVENSDDKNNDNKRKLDEYSSQEGSAKKAKLEETEKCVRPRGVKRIYKGATFWPSNFRQKLCTCSECISMYKDLSVLFLIDPEDTVTAYETLGKERNEGNSVSQYEKGLKALSSLDRIQQINALTEYNKMRDKLLDFLKSFKDKKEIVKEEDIKAFFAGIKAKREPDGVYFCR